MSESTTPTYAQLAEYLAYLAQLADITGGLVDLDDMRPLALEVRLASVKALLYARQSDILDQDNVEQFPFFLELLNGVAVEVESVTGTNPQNGTVRALAVQAITYGVAAQIEFAAYPEQQLGDSARAGQLQGRFTELLDRLRAVVAEGAEGALPASVGGPRGSFPPARPYPDAAERWPGSC
ncbi:hypothetical protein [Nocardioides soli]|uniref:Uncharacterized protein n=1 Tax=Nocardioides soli TaxID=1036020 RepID=A0A7W4VSQ4_9ACTN|nr:hypothetical protein [Nocardioides soli]MBB3041019.1 hypothetical protein [Nocardioides soli]